MLTITHPIQEKPSFNLSRKTGPTVAGGMTVWVLCMLCML